MRFRLYILLLLSFASTTLLAQTGTSASDKKSLSPSAQDTLKAVSELIEKPTATKNKTEGKLDSLQFTKERIQQKLDSLNPKNKISRYSQKIDSTKSGMRLKLDSLNPQHKINRYNLKLDSVRSRLTSKIDSLGRLSVRDVTHTKRLDSLKLKLDSLKNGGPMKGIKNAEEKITSVQNGVSKKVEGAESAINEKLKLFSANGGNAPGSVNLPDGNLTSTLKLPKDIAKPSLNGKLPAMGKFDSGNILKDAKVPKAEVGKLGNAGDEVKKLKKKSRLPNVKGSSEVKDFQKGMGKVNEVTGKASEYGKDIRNVAEGNLEEVNVESKIASIGEMKGLESEMAHFNKLNEIRNSDPDVAKELALNEAKELAVNHFMGHEEELKAAMQQLSKLKAKQKDAEVIIDLFKKPENPMKGKSFRERLLPGFNLQIQSSSNLWLDFNPFVGYRWSSRWTTGIGWNERLSTYVKTPKFIAKEHLFGPRSYVEFKVKENFHVKAEIEYMNALVTSPYLVNRAEPNGRAWVWSYFAGVKKSFALSKALKGNAQVLYNLYNPQKRSPYLSRLNIRMGFEFPPSKKRNRPK